MIKIHFSGPQNIGKKIEFKKLDIMTCFAEIKKYYKQISTIFNNFNPANAILLILFSYNAFCFFVFHFLV